MASFGDHHLFSRIVFIYFLKFLLFIIGGFVYELPMPLIILLSEFPKNACSSLYRQPMETIIFISHGEHSYKVS